jgi:hypothetical protein
MRPLRLSILRRPARHLGTRLEQHVVHVLVDTGDGGAFIRAGYPGTMLSML